MLTPRRTASLLAVVAGLGMASPARAQNHRPDPSAADKATARALMDEGDALLKRNEVASALQKYQAADTIMGVPTTGISLAETQARLHLLVEAADTFARVQRYPARPNEPKPFTVARERASKRLAELAPRIPSVTIQVAPTEPIESIRVVIDGRELSPATRFVPRKLNPGRHEAVVDCGDRRGSATFELLEGDGRIISVLLAPTGLPRGASVGADGSDTGSASNEGYDVPRGDSVPPVERPSAFDLSGMHPGVWIGAGVAGAGLVVGTITGGLALAARGTLDDSCPGGVCRTADARDAYDRAYALAHTSTVSFVLAGVGAGAAATTWLLTKDTGRTPASASIAPIVGPGFIGLRGAF